MNEFKKKKRVGGRKGREIPMNRVWGSFEVSLKKKPPQPTKSRCTYACV